MYISSSISQNILPKQKEYLENINAFFLTLHYQFCLNFYTNLI